VGTVAGSTAALSYGQRASEIAARKLATRALAREVAGKAAGALALRAGSRAAGYFVPGLQVALGVQTARDLYGLAEDQRKTHQAEERMANFKAGKGYRLIASEDKSSLAFPKPGQTTQRWSEPRSAIQDNLAAGRVVRQLRAKQLASGYYASRGGKKVWNKFSPETLAARAAAREGQR
jgi:hypothetical protein